ncbi:MAG TPA: plastocyanin/azurin family copper-binding protein [Mycobacteriales bacterium]|nr:plastocyanin/azurin family copper-binding protein [Mycobacteriales bacterium]
MGLAPSTRTRIAAAVLALPLLAGSVALTATAVSAQGAPAGVQATNALKFEPASLTVPVGTEVTWTNEGIFHTVTGGADGTEDPSSPIGNGTLADASSTYAVTFDKPGTFPYFCQPHISSGMKGEIVVTAAGGGAAPAPGGSGAPAPAPTGPTTAASAPQSPSGAPRPDANPSDADPAQVDPGNVQSSDDSGPGGGDEEGSSDIPGSTAEDNPALKAIDAQRAADKGKLGGFNALLAASTAALLALCVAIFASTRPRRTTR